MEEKKKKNTESRAKTMLMYLRGEKDLDEIARSVGRPRRSTELDRLDVELITWVSENKDLVKVNLTELSRRTGVPTSKLHDRWRRMQSKRLRLNITVQGTLEAGSPKGGLCSHSGSCPLPRPVALILPRAPLRRGSREHFQARSPRRQLPIELPLQ